MVTYKLKDLLMKMGAADALENGRLHWQYFNKTGNDIAGSANVRLLEDDTVLTATLTHTVRNYKDEKGIVHPFYTHNFFMEAVRTPKGEYAIRDMGFDSESYQNPPKSTVELGLSVFHAHALSISIKMVEQAFLQKDHAQDDIEEGHIEAPQPANVFRLTRKRISGGAGSNIIPFPRVVNSGGKKTA